MISIRKQISIPPVCLFGLGLCIFVLSILPRPVNAFGNYYEHHSNTVDLHSSKPKQQVNNRIKLFEDPEGRYTIEDILSPSLQEQFGELGSDNLNFGYSESTFWVKLSVRNNGDYNRSEWWYQLDLPLLDQSEFYLLPYGSDDTSKMIHKSLSYDTPLDEREVNHVTQVYQFKLESGEKADIYLKVKSNFSIHLPLFIYTPEGFANSVAVEELLYGAFMGSILILTAYNLFMFISVKETTFLYYILYMASYLIFLLTERVHGLSLIGEIPPLFHKENLYFYIWTAWLFALALARSFLETKEYEPDIDAVIKLFIAFALVSVVISPLLDTATVIQWAVFGTIPYAILMVWVAYIAMKRGNPVAHFYFTAWFLNFSGVCVYALTVTGFLSFNFVTSNSPHFGIICQMIIISFALADRIKVAQRRAAIANQQSVVNLRRYRSLFDNAVEGIFQISLNRRFIDANAAMAKMLGFDSAHQMISDTNDALAACYLDAKDRNSVVAQIQSGKDILEYEATYRSASGDERWAASSMRIIYDKENRPSHLEGTFVDITERIERVQDRVEKDIAEASASAKSRFLANMSHEIRTPLTAIIGYSETLLDDKLSAAQKRESSEIVVKSSKHLLELVNDILDHSKIDAEQMITERLSVELLPLFSEIRSYFSPKAAEKNIEFHIKYEYPLPEKILTDPTRFKQILINLCANALKFTDRGSISISSRLLEDQELLEVEVKDTGIGLKPNQISGLFDPFAQASPSIARQHGGTGLGLSISKRLTEMLGGSIEVHSTYGEGSSFVVTIATGSLEKTRLLRNASDVGQLRNDEQVIMIPELCGRVLYAEDNELNTKLVEQLINKTDIELHTVSNGAQALELVTRANERFDLILMDIQMPIMDGRVATIAIREAGINTPIIAVTANVMAEDISEYLGAGCAEVMPKPIQKQAFYDLLSRYLPSSNPISPPAPEVDVEVNQVLSDSELGEHKKISGTVLVAEDNEINSRLISLYLTKIGVKILLAKTGKDAIEKTQQYDVDLVIMDQHMPEQEGPEAIEYLREHGFDKPILAFTASDDIKDQSLMRDAGADGMIEKPIIFEQLYEALSEHLGLQETEDTRTEAIWEDEEMTPIIMQFIEDLPFFMASLQKAFDSQDWKTIRELSHQVIGMAGSLGFPEVAESAKHLENALKTGQIIGLKKLFDQFKSDAHDAEERYRSA